MSEEVLDGLKGVEHVSSHFLGSREANTVWYDPALISVEDMENALQDGGGYLGTVEPPRGRTPLDSKSLTGHAPLSGRAKTSD